MTGARHGRLGEIARTRRSRSWNRSYSRFPRRRHGGKSRTGTAHARRGRPRETVYTRVLGVRDARARRRHSASRWSHVGMMASWECRWGGYAMNAVRVVVRAMVPPRRRPMGYKAQRRERGNGENCGSGSGVTVHRTTVRVAEDREAVRIVAGVGPRRTGIHTAWRSIGNIARVGHNAGAADHRYSGKEC